MRPASYFDSRESLTSILPVQALVSLVFFMAFLSSGTSASSSPESDDSDVDTVTSSVSSEPLSKKQRESNAALSDSDDFAVLFTADAGTAIVVLSHV